MRTENRESIRLTSEFPIALDNPPIAEKARSKANDRSRGARRKGGVPYTRALCDHNSTHTHTHRARGFWPQINKSDACKYIFSAFKRFIDSWKSNQFNRHSNIRLESICQEKAVSKLRRQSRQCCLKSVSVLYKNSWTSLLFRCS